MTINRFRNRVKNEINNIFTQTVLLLAERGFITLDVEYIDGTKIESKANKYTFVWRKTVEKNRAKLQAKIQVLLHQIDEVIAQDKAAESEAVEFTPESLTSLISELKDSLASEPEPTDKEQKKARRERKKQIKELEQHRDEHHDFFRLTLVYFGKIPKNQSPENYRNVRTQKRGCAVKNLITTQPHILCEL